MMYRTTPTRVSGSVENTNSANVTVFPSSCSTTTVSGEISAIAWRLLNIAGMNPNPMITTDTSTVRNVSSLNDRESIAAMNTDPKNTMMNGRIASAPYTPMPSAAANSAVNPAIVAKYGNDFPVMISIGVAGVTNVSSPR